MQNNITILLPTMGRPDNITRQLLYYNSLGWEGKIFIGDSSDSADRRAIERVVSEAQDSLDVSYFFYPKHSHPNSGYCLRDLADEVKTEYCVYTGDDDYLLPSVLVKCAEFLERHPEYAACGSNRLKYILDERGNQIINVLQAKYPQCKQSSAFDRWVQYTQCGLSCQYRVHRVDVWRAAYQYTHLIKDTYLGQEFLPCSLSHILGKHHILDDFGTLFEINRNQIYSFSKTPYWRSVCDEGFSSDIKSIVRIFNDIFQAKTKTAEVLNAIEKQIERHIVSMLNNQLQSTKRDYPVSEENVQAFKSMKQSEFLVFQHIVQNS